MQNKQLMLGAVGREQSTDKLGVFFDGTLCFISFTSALRVGETTCCVHQRDAVKGYQRVLLQLVVLRCVCAPHTTCMLERNTLMLRRMWES